MSYRGAGQAERTQAGPTAFRLSALGVSATADAAGAVHYTRSPDGQLLAQRLPPPPRCYLTDALGSVVGLTGASGALVASYRRRRPWRPTSLARPPIPVGRMWDDRQLGLDIDPV